MDALHQQSEDLQCASVVGQGRLDKLEKEAATSKRELSAVHEGLEGYGEQLADLSKRSLDLATRVQAQESQIRGLETASAHCEKQVNQQEKIIESHEDDLRRVEAKNALQCENIEAEKTKLQNLEAHFTKAEAERLAELKVVCEKVDRQEAEAQVMATQLRTQLRACRHAFGHAVEEVRKSLEVKIDGKAELSDMNEALTDHDSRLTDLRRHIEAELAKKLCAEEIEKTHVALHDWVHQTRETLRNWLAQNLHEFAAQQSAKLEESQGWVKSVTGWIEQVHVREKGLSHVLLHVVEKESPELMKMLEEALRMPQQPKLKKSLTA